MKMNKEEEKTHTMESSKQASLRKKQEKIDWGHHEEDSRWKLENERHKSQNLSERREGGGGAICMLCVRFVVCVVDDDGGGTYRDRMKWLVAVVSNTYHVRIHRRIYMTHTHTHARKRLQHRYA